MYVVRASAPATLLMSFAAAMKMCVYEAVVLSHEQPAAAAAGNTANATLSGPSTILRASLLFPLPVSTDGGSTPPAPISSASPFSSICRDDQATPSTTG